MITTRLAVRQVARRMTARTFSDAANEHLQNLRMIHSKEPIPFSGHLPVVPVDSVAPQLEHKKISVIGCGQVGMGIAVSVKLN